MQFIALLNAMYGNFFIDLSVVIKNPKVLSSQFLKKYSDRFNEIHAKYKEEDIDY